MKKRTPGPMPGMKESGGYQLILSLFTLVWFAFAGLKPGCGVEVSG